MFAIIIALVVLAAGAAAIYLILKNMSEDGVDIAAPGSCKQRGRCKTPSPPMLEEAEQASLQIADGDDQRKTNA
ncbi:MAG: hypothetical protein KA435_03910 [Azonexus sp.]|nr:hypothetical protein [Azonexus sp.]MBP6202184.1 hypothetical protein [Azonexus sp.]